jgi:hypothetical protein
LEYQAAVGMGPGYKELVLSENCILLNYHGNRRSTMEMVEEAWAKRAGQLCPQGYSRVYFRHDKIAETFESDVNGLSVTLGTSRPMAKGLVKCFGKVEADAMTDPASQSRIQNEYSIESLGRRACKNDNTAVNSQPN